MHATPLDLVALLGLGVAIVGLAGVSTAPRHWVLTCLFVALLVFAVKTKGMRRKTASVLSVVAAVAAIIFWLASFQPTLSKLNSPGHLARTRLSIVSYLNTLRAKDRAPALSFDPVLANDAQELVGEQSAQQTGLPSGAATPPGLGPYATWVTLDGMGSDWKELFRLSGLGKPLPMRQTGGPIFGLITYGPFTLKPLVIHRPALSATLTTVGIGIRYLTTTNLMLVVDLSGPEQAFPTQSGSREKYASTIAVNEPVHLTKGAHASGSAIINP